jgi:lantibiotic modifying enzyme
MTSRSLPEEVEGDSPAMEALMLSLAVQHGEHILDNATTLADGSLTWHRGFSVAFAPTPDAGLFNGRLGEAFLFAALAMATRESEYADVVDRILLPLRRILRRTNGATRIAENTGPGLYGIGSMLYGLVSIGIILDAPEYIDDARFATAHCPRYLTVGRAFDICGGTAGLLVGLLAVARTGCDIAVDLAIKCGDHLLAHRAIDPVSTHRAWQDSSGHVSAGFAHGSSGIAAALIGLFRLTGNSRLRDGVFEAFAFEHTLRVGTYGDWPDFRGQAGPWLCSWCHGAAGIGFARLATLDEAERCDENDVFDDLSKALQRSAMSAALSDGLCCGSAGRIDLLLEAGIRLDNPSLIRAAFHVANVCFADGSYRIPTARRAHEMPGLWQGLTGIAYTLLRLARPLSLPSILMFDTDWVRR